MVLKKQFFKIPFSRSVYEVIATLYFERYLDFFYLRKNVIYFKVRFSSGAPVIKKIIPFSKKGPIVYHYRNLWVSSTSFNKQSFAYFSGGFKSSTFTRREGSGGKLLFCIKILMLLKVKGFPRGIPHKFYFLNFVAQKYSYYNKLFTSKHSICFPKGFFITSFDNFSYLVCLNSSTLLFPFISIHQFKGLSKEVFASKLFFKGLGLKVDKFVNRFLKLNINLSYSVFFFLPKKIKFFYTSKNYILLGSSSFSVINTFSLLVFKINRNFIFSNQKGLLLYNLFKIVKLIVASYKKILFFFKKLNVHKNYFGSGFSSFFSFSFRNSRINIDLNRVLSSLYSVLKLIKSLSFKGRILLVANKGILPFCSFFKRNTSKYFVTFFWIYGILSNWSTFSRSYRSSLVCVNKSRKLRFVNKFYTFFSIKKPNLVILFQSRDMSNIIQECSQEGIPVVGISNRFFNKNSSYRLCFDIGDFFVRNLVFQLIVSQLQNISKCDLNIIKNFVNSVKILFIAPSLLIRCFLGIRVNVGAFLRSLCCSKIKVTFFQFQIIMVTLLKIRSVLSFVV